MVAFRATYCVIHCLGLLSLMLAGLLTPASAQVPTAITSDGSLGTTVTQDGNIFEITDGTQQGRNLFHSFDRFDVGTGDIARFTGPTNIENILNRVTGGQPSMIDGMLQSDIAGANFYLLNPSGVILGSNATLDVQGSFHVSTADVLRFDDGAAFLADLGGQSMLTVAAPVAFGFLQTQPVRIRIAGSHLQVPEGETLSVVGGNMEITGDAASASFEAPTLSAPGGRIDLVSVGSSGDVVLGSSGPSPNPGVDSFEHLGKMTISDGALVDVSSDAGGGTVVIRGGRLRVDNSRIFADTLGGVDGAPIGIDVQVTEDVGLTNGTLITTDALGAGTAGNIQVTADTVALIADSFIRSNTFGEGKAGTVSVTAGTVSLTARASIRSDASHGARGNAGIVTVTADIVSLTDLSSISSDVFGDGDAGMVTVTADTISLTDFGAIRSNTSPESSGNAGMVTLIADTVSLTDLSFISSDAFGEGDAGIVTVMADTLSLTNASRIRNRNTSNNAPGNITGTVKIIADTVSLTNGSEIISGTSGTSDGGIVTIIANSVSLTDFSEIDSDSFSGARGDPGTVTVMADTVSLTNGSEISSEILSGTGNAGDVIIHAREALTIREGSQISSLTSGAGNAGSITLNVGQLLADGNSEVTSSSLTGATGNAGMVTIQGLGGPGTMARLITLSSAGVETRSNGAAGGNIVVAAGTVELTQGARVTAASSGEGNAGNITITAADTFLSEDSSVTTEARQAQGGEIRIAAQSMVRLRNTQVTTEVEGGDERAGNIIIDPDFVIVENSQLVTRAEGGPGGDIRITAEAAVLINPDSVVDASSAQNIDGEIDIQAPVSNLSSSLSQLPQRFLSAQLRSQCAERWRGGSVSRLVESGRDGLPARPGTLLLSPLTEITHQTDEAKKRLSETSSANVGQRRMGNHGYTHSGFLQTLWNVDCAS